MKVKYVTGGYLCQGYHRYHHQDHPRRGCHHCHRPGQWSRQYRRHQSHGPGTNNFRHNLTTAQLGKFCSCVVLDNFEVLGGSNPRLIQDEDTLLQTLTKKYGQ